MLGLQSRLLAGRTRAGSFRCVAQQWPSASSSRQLEPRFAEYISRRNFLRPCGTGALPSENSAEVSWECPRRLSPARRARGILEPVQSRPITAVATAVERRRSFSSFGGSSNFNVEEKHSVDDAVLSAGDDALLGDGAATEDGEEREGAQEDAVVVSRNRKERRDSVTVSIVKEREAHLQRLAGADVDRAMAKIFKSLSLGTRKRPRQAGGFNLAYNEEGKQVHSGMGAGGFARWMGSASKGWPTFKHRLPEVALAGHTNCGKSTLVNALSGIHPRRGPASTSDRAGWTDLVGFYQVGKKPPVLTLVDLPGYGHAVATKHAIKGWLRMIKEYVSSREELCSCCVLVDSTRGFCEEDRTLLRLLAKKAIPHQIVLTKADLLTPELLSACVLLLRRDLGEILGDEKRASTIKFSAVCGNSGAGVTALWKELDKIASKSPGSLVATQAAHLAARQAREKAAGRTEAQRATSREH